VGHLDASDAGIVQRLTALEVGLQNLKETNSAQHTEVMDGLRDLRADLFKGPDSLEGRVRVLEGLGNKGLAIVAVITLCLGGLLSMVFGWVPNPFTRAGK